MLKNLKTSLGAATLLFFSLNLVSAQPEKTGALATLLASDSVAAVAESLKFETSAPAAVAEKGQADSPAPGRGFNPAVQDKVRDKLIMKLISDIYNGVQLPYAQDGVTFKNKEGLLPQQPLGFYREYTLITGDAPHTVVIGGVTYQVSPDLGARGSERVVIGGGKRIYYTPDHYRTFIELAVVY
jgi:ribonuclease T1